MDTLFAKRLFNFYQKNEQKTLFPRSDIRKKLSPYRTPTQKIESNLFLATLNGMRRNKSKC